MNVGLCTSSHNKKLNISISAEIGEKNTVSRKPLPKQEFLHMCRVLCLLAMGYGVVKKWGHSP